MRVLLLAVTSYALGCLNGAYYAVRLRTGDDIRTLGSGNAGARNVLRTRGRAAAAIAVAWDVLKGALAVVIARVVAPDTPGAAGIAALLVVSGHVWPAQLQFRGGKGAATIVGAMFVAAPLVSLACVAVASVVMLASRQFSASGLAGIAAAPPLLAIAGVVSYPTLLGLAAACGVVLVVHHPRFARTPSGSPDPR